MGYPGHSLQSASRNPSAKTRDATLPAPNPSGQPRQGWPAGQYGQILGIDVPWTLPKRSLRHKKGTVPKPASTSSRHRAGRTGPIARKNFATSPPRSALAFAN